MRTNLQINPNIHAKLKAISDKRKAEGHPSYTMASIIAEMVLKQHKKELENG